MRRFLCWLIGCECRQEATIRFRVGPVLYQTLTVRGEDVMALILTDEQQVSLSIDPRTAAGNAAQVDGIPVWQVSDAAILTLVVAEDGKSAVVKSAGPVGTSQVSVSADADLGEGVRTITGTLDIEVKAAEAVTLGITAGTPEVKTA